MSSNNNVESQPCAIGIDLGGTKIQGALIDAAGHVIAEHKFSTASDGTFDAIFAQIVALIAQLRTHVQGPFAGIGIGVPGPLDFKAGTIVSMPNLPGTNVEIVKQLMAVTHCPVFLENDANVALLAEVKFGRESNSTQAIPDTIMFTLGTGVGGAVFVNGSIVHGASGAAGELGHLTVEFPGRLCGCGRRGCLETIASGPGLNNLAAQLEIADTTEGLIKHWREVGIQKCELGRRFVEALARAISVQINTLNPRQILFGGGFGVAAYSTYVDSLRDAARSRCFPSAWNAAEFVVARQGNMAGCLGAASLALDDIATNVSSFSKM